LTTAAPVPTEVEAYVARVRAALADVPAEERNELIAEVEASLYETASEGGGSVAARLGPPEDFAAELRSAAGLSAAEAPSSDSSLRETLERIASDPRARAAGRVLRDLAPVWWVVRGYVAVAALALLADSDWSISHRSVPQLGSAEAGLAVIAFAIAASVALGLWTRASRRSLRPPLLLLNAVLLGSAIPVAQHLAQRATTTTSTATVIQTAVVPGLAYNGTPLTNVYPYSRDGRLLHDVFLYTDSGAPIEVRLAPDPNRRLPRTTSGRSVFNTFPIRYYQPGTRTVRRPNAGPVVHVPQLRTPPLRAKRR
jgi:hypothetical protein